MPRFAHDDVRVTHKEAWTVARLGYEVILLCKAAPVNSYLGMQVIRARAAAGSPLTRGILGLPSLLAQSLSMRADVYVLENPDTLLLGFILVLLKRRVIYSTHEDFADKTQLQTAIPRWFRRPLGWLICRLETWFAYLNAGTIVTQRSLRQAYGERVLLIENAPLTFGPVMDQARQDYQSLPRPETPTLVYAGILSVDRGLMRMLDLLIELRRRHPWKLKLIGPFHPAELQNEAIAHPAWPHVDYIGRVPHTAALAHIQTATMGLALLADVAGYSRASPNKLYEYMLLGAPFIASDFNAWRESIGTTAAGLFVDPSNTALIAATANALYENPQHLSAMAQAGSAFIESQFNWHLVAQPLEALVQSLMRQRLPASSTHVRTAVKRQP
jgi:glycosyltransferase involved in cell wall biosynthesis